MLLCLSPNGQSQRSGDGPVTKLLIGTITGIVRLERDAVGASWREAAASLKHKHISSVLYEPESGKLFAGCHAREGDGGLFVSEDLGETWQPCDNGLSSPHIYTLALQERDGKPVLFAGLEPPALHRSDDLGTNWIGLPAMSDVPHTDRWSFPPPPHIAHVKNVAFHPDEPDTLYVCIEQGALLATNDGGASWYEISSYDSVEDTFYHDTHRVAVANDPNRLYMTTGIGFYASRDRGKTWDNLQTEKDRLGYPDPLFLDPRDDDVVFMGGAGDAPERWREKGVSNAGFIVSHDGGKTWEERMTGLPDPVVGNIEAMSMAVSPDGLSFAAGTATGDVYFSDDEGRNWHLVVSDIGPISKSRHYRHFLSAKKKAELEDLGRRERAAAGLAAREYTSHV